MRENISLEPPPRQRHGESRPSALAHVNDSGRRNRNLGIFAYPINSPFGMNGTFYYSRITYANFFPSPGRERGKG
jgi:hypothetical protein